MRVIGGFGVHEAHCFFALPAGSLFRSNSHTETDCLTIIAIATPSIAPTTPSSAPSASASQQPLYIGVAVGLVLVLVAAAAVLYRRGWGHWNRSRSSIDQSTLAMVDNPSYKPQDGWNSDTYTTGEVSMAGPTTSWDGNVYSTTESPEALYSCVDDGSKV